MLARGLATHGDAVWAETCRRTRTKSARASSSSAEALIAPLRQLWYFRTLDRIADAVGRASEAAGELTGLDADGDAALHACTEFLVAKLAAGPGAGAEEAELVETVRGFVRFHWDRGSRATAQLDGVVCRWATVAVTGEAADDRLAFALWVRACLARILPELSADLAHVVELDVREVRPALVALWASVVVPAIPAAAALLPRCVQLGPDSSAREALVAVLREARVGTGPLAGRVAAVRAVASAVLPRTELLREFEECVVELAHVWEEEGRRRGVGDADVAAALAGLRDVLLLDGSEAAVAALAASVRAWALES